MVALLTVSQLRRVVQATWDATVLWMIQKPRVLRLPRPEQQIQFELASRLRDTLRRAAEAPSWDRLFFDASGETSAGSRGVFGRRPTIWLDTHQLFGLDPADPRTPSTPDLALSVHVLRAPPAVLELDDDGRPRDREWVPSSLGVQGLLLEDEVRTFDELSRHGVESWLFIVYANEAQRTTVVDVRAVASWASWKEVSPTLRWAARHFRVKAAR